MSYSGKCVISNYTTGRDANRGACAQSCRWKYNLVEEKENGEYEEVINGIDSPVLLQHKRLMYDRVYSSINRKWNNKF